jgi:uncharacterized delta-60 repeat protein
MRKLLVLTIYCLFSFSIFAQPGTNDPSFNIGTGFNDGVFETVIQADGKIIAGGYFTTFNGLAHNRLVRLNSDGSLDNTFNIGTGFDAGVLTISIQTDGKIIVGGDFTTFNGNVANRLVRLNSNGTIDNTFNIGSGFDNSIYTTNIQTDGKIIVGGVFALFNASLHLRIVRLNTDGSLDTSFNPNSSFNGNVYSTAIQSDGKIIAGGNSTIFNGTSIGCIARLNTDGSLDASFNNGTGYNSDVWTISIQADGKIITGGYFTSFNGTSINRISRLNSNGSSDISFNVGSGFGDGVFTTNIQADGKIIVGGLYSSFNGSQQTRLARLNTNGSLDATFNIGTGFGNDVLTTTIQADGKIIAGGNFSNISSISRNKLARLRVCNATNSTDVINSCTPITWIDGNSYSTNNNTATYTLTNAVGCDSIITLNFTRLTQSSADDIITSCDPIIWVDGNSYSTNNNTATFTLTNAAGCDSVVTLNFTRIIVDIATSTSGQTITAIAPGSDYQWLDCNNNNTAIAGETNQSFIAGANGSYAVIITNNGCTDTSACVNITSTGMNHNDQLEISISPNPFTHQTIIKFGEEKNNLIIELFNVIGEKVKSNSFNGKEYILNRGELNAGVYFMHIKQQGKSIHIGKIIIQ